jgi:tRNA(Arg) A34 adenosine deaminase TadA
MVPSGLTDFDERLLRESIDLAREHMREGSGGPFGAVIARGEAVLARGWNQVTSELDPTAHAEVVAIRRACAALGDFRLDGCTLYASCEPCPMCLAAIYWARIDRVVFGAGRADAAAIGFDDSRIYDEISLPRDARTLHMRQLLRDEARSAMEEWVAKSDRIPY